MRTLTPHSSLESLRKEAKAWLKALRAGDPAAQERLRAILPDSPADPSLRHVQLALAREFGLAGWAALKDVLDDLALALRSHAELADLLLQSAKPWDSDKPGAARIFKRVSARMPGLARHSIHAAALCGDLDEVKRRLAQSPAAAQERGGPLDWQPLQYLAYGRLPGAEAHAVEIAQLLLAHGADPNVDFDDGWGNPFTLLNGLVGQGEQDRTPHPCAEELVRLFLDAGTHAFDTQVNYDTQLGPDETRWLELLWSRSDPARWREPIYAKGKASTLDYLLGNAVDRRHERRIQWLLTHGADPNGTHGYTLQPIILHGQLYGGPHILALLEQHGGKARPLKGEEAFMAACLSADLDDIRQQAAASPRLLHHPRFLIEVAQRDLDDVAALLLELGMPADLAPHDRKRALHWCGQCGSVKVARLLIGAGADIDARGSSYDATPLGFATYFGQPEMIALLAPLSRDVFNLSLSRSFERLDAVLQAEPALVHSRNREGDPLICVLPDNEDAAVEAAEMLLRHGADPSARTHKGDTAAQAARKRGLAEAADLLEVSAEGVR